MIFLASLGEKSATRSNLFRRNIGLILGIPAIAAISIAVCFHWKMSTFLSARKQTGNDKTTTSASIITPGQKCLLGIENETFDVSVMESAFN